MVNNSEILCHTLKSFLLVRHEVKGTHAAFPIEFPTPCSCIASLTGLYRDSKLFPQFLGEELFDSPFVF